MINGAKNFSSGDHGPADALSVDLQKDEATSGLGRGNAVDTDSAELVCIANFVGGLTVDVFCLVMMMMLLSLTRLKLNLA